MSPAGRHDRAAGRQAAFLDPPRGSGFFDPDLQRAVRRVGPCAQRCAIIDPVLDFDERSGSTATRSADALLTMSGSETSRSTGSSIRTRTRTTSRQRLPEGCDGGADRDWRTRGRRPAPLEGALQPSGPLSHGRIAVGPPLRGRESFQLGGLQGSVMFSPATRLPPSPMSSVTRPSSMTRVHAGWRHRQSRLSWGRCPSALAEHPTHPLASGRDAPLHRTRLPARRPAPGLGKPVARQKAENAHVKGQTKQVS